MSAGGSTVRAVSQAGDSERQVEALAAHRATLRADALTLTELVDELSKLAPVRLKGFNATLGEKADEAEVRRAADAIREAGGAAGEDAGAVV